MQCGVCCHDDSASSIEVTNNIISVGDVVVPLPSTKEHEHDTFVAKMTPSMRELVMGRSITVVRLASRDARLERLSSSLRVSADGRQLRLDTPDTKLVLRVVEISDIYVIEHGRSAFPRRVLENLDETELPRLVRMLYSISGGEPTSLYLVDETKEKRAALLECMRILYAGAERQARQAARAASRMRLQEIALPVLLSSSSIESALPSTTSLEPSPTSTAKLE